MAYRSIVCVPGFASSRLTLNKDVDKDVLWIDLWNMTARRSLAAEAPTEEDYAELIEKHGLDVGTEEDVEALISVVSTWWVNHICLDPSNDWGPPNGVAPLQLMTGLSGINYLDPHGPIMKRGTDVWATLVNNLQKAGVPQAQILGAPYDWRLVPTRMDFTGIETIIENETQRSGQPVVVAAHSLGNRVIDTIARRKGQAWCSANIHAWVSIGAPWLGAGKAVRSLVTGDDLGTTKMGIGLIDTQLGKQLCRSFGATPWMVPITSTSGGYKEFNIPDDGFVFTNGPQGQPLSNQAAFANSGTNDTNTLMATHYDQHSMPTFTGNAFGSRIHEAPPVDRLYAVFGTGLNTEQSYFMKQSGNTLALDSTYDGTANGYVTKKGIRYETSNTVQHRDGTKNSGDGTVPYGSLTQHRAWAKPQNAIKISEVMVPGAKGEHLKIMQSDELQNTLLQVAKI